MKLKQPKLFAGLLMGGFLFATVILSSCNNGETKSEPAPVKVDSPATTPPAPPAATNTDSLTKDSLAKAKAAADTKPVKTPN
ncbi:MAG: hypothetical protein ACOYKE_02060 [Ferruginibacter sp.]